jgi:hypothetical protein
MTLASGTTPASQVHVSSEDLHLPSRTTVVTADFARRVAAGSGLTTPGAVLVASALLGVGAMADMTFGGSLGVGFGVMFLLGCAAMATTLRIRSLATAVIAPPLLFATTVLLAAKVSGNVRGTRALALDTATTLALSAPVLFGGTALAAGVAVVRLGVHVVRRRSAPPR